jgi:hypothetical protein
LKNLFVADKMKSCISDSILNDVNRKEDEAFLVPHELGKLVDRLVTSEDELKSGSYGLARKQNNSFRSNQKHDYMRRQSVGRCYSCSSTEHYANSAQCPNAKQNASKGQYVKMKYGDRTSEGYSNGANNFEAGKGGSRNFSAKQYVEDKISCVFCGKSGHNFFKCPERKKNLPCDLCGKFNHASNMCRLKGKRVNRVAILAEHNIGGNVEQEHALSKSVTVKADCNTFPSEDDMDSHIDLDVKKLYDLSEIHEQQCINFVQCESVSEGLMGRESKGCMASGVVKVKMGDRKMEMLIDSGAEISIFKSSDLSDEMVKALEHSTQGTVQLVGAFGEVVTASLINIACALALDDGKLLSPVVLTCAVTDRLKSRNLLTIQDYDLLNVVD